MAFTLHLEDGPGPLAEQLAALLAREPADVFAPELIVVPTPGVERWLLQRLSHHLGADKGDDGVCAGVEVVSPRSLVAALQEADHDDPWHPDRLAWAVLEAMDELVGTPGFEALTRHVGADASDPETATWQQKARQTRRLAVARRLAGLYTSYADDRPEVMRAWEASTDAPNVDADLAWQAPLWRATLESMRRRHGDGQMLSPVARLDATLDRLRSEDVDAPQGRIGLGSVLPQRISLFGQTRLSQSTLMTLDALAQARDVHLWLPHPSPALWRELEGRASVVVRHQDESARAAKHPLLASLGRDVRELQSKLAAYPHLDTHVQVHPSSDDSSTLLHRLQADIRANRPASRAPWIDHDQSLQVHACHGPARQVEALRETLTWLIESSEGRIQPRDIIVMCPDIETYAPLIKATFATFATLEDSSDHHPGQQLRVQLADRALFSTNSLAQTALRLTQLVAGRMTASQVLDFAALPAVQARFGFDAESLDRIAAWVKETEARWGLDAKHRGEYGLSGLADNTWARALDRLALGLAVSADSDGEAAWLAPVDDLGSGDIETASQFIRLMDALESAADGARVSGEGAPAGTASPAHWFEWLRRSVLAVADAPLDAQWQVAQFEREVAYLAQDASERTTLRLTDIRVMIEQRWAPRATRTNFRNGAVSICTMMPMRSVPHKAVVLLGLDDGVFPRQQITDGDDVLARHPLVGERDPRSEDRQLLLDGLMAASDHFIVFYSGFDERDGSRREAAVPVQEIIATAMASLDVPTAGGDSDEQPLPPFLYSHPLQAFDARNFNSDSPLPGGSFDRNALEGAQMLRQVLHAEAERATDPEASSDPSASEHLRGLPTPLISHPLAIVPKSDLTLEDLARFLDNPARTFLRDRLDITVPREAEEVADTIPIELDGLENWAVGDRILRSLLRGLSVDAALAQERQRGGLPPALLGQTGRKTAQEAQAIVAQIPQGERESREIAIDLALPPASEQVPSQDVRISGIVTGIVGHEVQVVNYSRVGAKHIAQAWVSLLGLKVAYPEIAWSAAVRGKGGVTAMVAPATGEDAERELMTLVNYYRHGLRGPLPVPAKTAHAYTAKYLSVQSNKPDRLDLAQLTARRAAANAWETDRFPGEGEDAWWERAFGGVLTFEQLCVTTGFENFAPRLWAPILSHLQERR